MKTFIKGILSTISPEWTTKLMFYHNFRKKLDLKNPSGFNEKLQYLKLNTYYNNPVITQCVDKYRVREYLKERGMNNCFPGCWVVLIMMLKHCVWTGIAFLRNLWSSAITAVDTTFW